MNACLFCAEATVTETLYDQIYTIVGFFLLFACLFSTSKGLHRLYFNADNFSDPFYSMSLQTVVLAQLE